MNSNPTLDSLLNSLVLFLRQQKELGGDDLPLPSSAGSGLAVNPSFSRREPPQQTINDKRALYSVSSEPVSPSFEEGIKVTIPEEVRGTQGSIFKEPEEWRSAETLVKLNELICECQKCPLGQSRNRFVFGVGDPHADVMLIGEAPGADEDKQGEPFVGAAGQLLNKILEAINFKRQEVYIANILKCRPPNNRTPMTDEVSACIPFLVKQAELIKPKAILCLGRVAATSLLGSNASLTDLRNKVHSWNGIPMIVTYHPAALLRNPNWKKPTWDDVQKFRDLYLTLKNSER